MNKKAIYNTIIEVEKYPVWEDFWEHKKNSMWTYTSYHNSNTKNYGEIIKKYHMQLEFLRWEGYLENKSKINEDSLEIMYPFELKLSSKGKKFKYDYENRNIFHKIQDFFIEYKALTLITIALIWAIFTVMTYYNK